MTAALDRYGNVLERYTYTPYGERTVLDDDWSSDSDGLSDIASNFGHQGGMIDVESGLMWFDRRYYHVSLGTWASADPLGYHDGMNLRQAYQSNPITNVDPFGLWSLSMDMTVTGAIGMLLTGINAAVVTIGNLAVSALPTIGTTLTLSSIALISISGGTIASAAASQAKRIADDVRSRIAALMFGMMKPSFPCCPCYGPAGVIVEKMYQLFVKPNDWPKFGFDSYIEMAVDEKNNPHHLDDVNRERASHGWGPTDQTHLKATRENMNVLRDELKKLQKCLKESQPGKGCSFLDIAFLKTVEAAGVIALGAKSLIDP